MLRPEFTQVGPRHCAAADRTFKETGHNRRDKLDKRERLGSTTGVQPCATIISKGIATGRRSLPRTETLFFANVIEKLKGQRNQ